MMDVFSKYNNTFNAPKDYIDSSSVFIFVTNMFYFLSRNYDIITSFNKAKQLDNEANIMMISTQPKDYQHNKLK